MISTVILLMLFAAIISSIRAAGRPYLKTHMAEISPTVAIFQEFQYHDGHWCWRGLCAEKTTFAEAAILVRDKTILGDIFDATLDERGEAWIWLNDPALTTESRYVMFTQTPNSDRLSVFYFIDQSLDITLGDAYPLLGRPTEISVQRIGVGGTNFIISFDICFTSGICVNVAQTTGKLTPYSVTRNFDFRATDSSQANPLSANTGNRWRGFIEYTPS